MAIVSEPFFSLAPPQVLKVWNKLKNINIWYCLFWRRKKQRLSKKTRNIKMTCDIFTPETPLFSPSPLWPPGSSDPVLLAILSLRYFHTVSATKTSTVAATATSTDAVSANISIFTLLVLFISQNYWTHCQTQPQPCRLGVPSTDTEKFTLFYTLLSCKRCLG